MRGEGTNLLSQVEVALRGDKQARDVVEFILLLHAVHPPSAPPLASRGEGKRNKREEKGGAPADSKCS